MVQVRAAKLTEEGLEGKIIIDRLRALSQEIRVRRKWHIQGTAQRMFRKRKKRLEPAPPAKGTWTLQKAQDSLRHLPFAPSLLTASIPGASNLSKNRQEKLHPPGGRRGCARISSYRICLTFLTGVTGMGVRVVGGEGNEHCRGGYYFTSPGASSFCFAPETILGEVRIRSVRILIGLGLTWFTRYWFPEELISPLAKPFLTLSLDSYFVCTQSTEASPTYVATSSIACSYFVFPLISHQIWCFLIPSCYGEQRNKYNRFLYLSGSRFSFFLFLTLPRVVPNVWYFLYFVGATSTNSLMIKLQPKIYDHIMLTVRISFIPSVCSQVPVIFICLPEPRGLSVETFTNNRRFLMVFPLLTAALSTPPDIWCQIVAPFLISSIIELTIFVASIVQVREEAGRVE
ncbi:PREDICTED: uncharacterized protein LOC109356236 [Lupinus angustifolius]|uniref:uncharacterized protein LOC109356236 n=1 Tax=Lupinus angustifolius TaxID=3871 RepID=UPI00092F48F5|nr:PREDICTED: uncharacterized protein LOC109356236 [Lupinus angustifolius]